jgi:hypothetical protein
MLIVNFYFPKTQYKHTFLFATNYTFLDMIQLLKNTMDNNRDIILTLNNKTLKYNDNTLLTNCNIKNDDNIYIKYDEFIDLNFVYPDLMSGIEMIFNKTDTLNDIIEAVKQEMDFDSNIYLTLNNKCINYNINDVITNCGIKNNDIIYVNYV